MPRTTLPDTTPSSSAAPAIVAVGIAFATWCSGFAAVNAWHLVSGGVPDDGTGDHATMLTVMSILVLLIKVLGAAIALASLRPVRHPRGRWVLGTALWAAASTLALYSAGNLVTAVGTSAGLLAPTDAWEAAGGVTLRSIAYLVFFLVGAVMAAALAVSYHRRHRLAWPVIVAGAIAAPALLGGLLVVVPALLVATTS